MANSVYEINKGINKPLDFYGLKAQYITYLAVGLVGLLILFAVMYIAGVPVFLSVPVVGGLGFVLFSWVIRYSKKYGEHGLMKQAAFRQVPSRYYMPQPQSIPSINLPRSIIKQPPRFIINSR